jgi:hypothetical protein
MVFRLKASMIDNRREWRRKVLDSILFFGSKGGDPWKGGI